jgi:hypothetical protein
MTENQEEMASDFEHKQTDGECLDPMEELDKLREQEARRRYKTGWLAQIRKEIAEEILEELTAEWYEKVVAVRRWRRRTK